MHIQLFVHFFVFLGELFIVSDKVGLFALALLLSLDQIDFLDFLLTLELDVGADFAFVVSDLLSLFAVLGGKLVESAV